MATISLCMIVKNEQDVLARCLESVQGICDEIIIADTGSTDRTKEIARRYTDKVYDFPWIDDFSAARNFALSKAEMDYCMWLDADDVLLPSDHLAVAELKNNLDGVDVVMMKYNVAFGPDGSPTYSYFRERIFKNSPIFRFHGAVHEAITPSGNILHSQAAVSHKKLHPSDPDRNLRIFEKQLHDGIPLTPREQFYYARELYYHARYGEAVEVLDTFIESGQGWIENVLDACLHLCYCYDGLGEPDKAFDALTRALRYSAPRAELACELGLRLMRAGNYSAAAFWYETALTRERPDTTGAFVSPDCYGYLPAIQLCVCYYRIGDMQRAVQYNELAGKYRPDDPAYLQNKAFFASLDAATTEID